VTEQQQVEVVWLKQTCIIQSIFWLVVIVLQELHLRTNTSVLGFFYPFTFLVTNISTIVFLVYQFFSAILGMEEEFNRKDLTLYVHVAFLVLRYLSLGIALLIAISTLQYLAFYFTVGSTLLGEESLEERPLRNADQALEELNTED
jgi:hypothetical protein